MNIKKTIKIFMITILLITSINTANAGIVKKAVGVAVLQRAGAFLLTGQGRSATLAVLKTAVQNPKVELALFSFLTYVMVTMPIMGGENIDKRARYLFHELQLDTKERVVALNQSMNMVRLNYIYLTKTVLKDIEEDRRYTCFNKKELTSKKDPDADIFQPYYLANGLNKTNKKLYEWDFASYSALVAHDPKGDDLEHDHIPSVSSILKYIEKRDKLVGLNRKKGVGFYINNNATAVEVHKDYHRIGRTFGNKKANDFDTLLMFKEFFKLNYWTIIQDEFISAIDSKDLKLATLKDFAYYGLSVDLRDPKVANAIRGVFIRNYRLCLYD